MKIGAIDIGSNSVRLMMWADGKTLYKRLKSTRLGEGLALSGRMSPQAIERTAVAVGEFVGKAQEEGAERIYAFATAAARSAANGEELLAAVRRLCGVEVDVLSGEDEAKIGLLGALGGADGGIIDVGGASTEITVQKDGKRIYSKSVNIGTVRIFDVAGRDLRKIEEVVGEKISAFGDCDFSGTDMRAIGGTASRIASIKLGLKEYDAALIDGTSLTVGEMRRYAEWLTSLTPQQIRERTILTKSADIVGGGAVLFFMMMEKFGIQNVTVSESDNLEGYVLYKLSEASGTRLPRGTERENQ